PCLPCEGTARGRFPWRAPAVQAPRGLRDRFGSRVARPDRQAVDVRRTLPSRSENFEAVPGVRLPVNGPSLVQLRTFRRRRRNLPKPKPKPKLLAALHAPT
ncbi:hypothetical protein ACFWN5_26635, partial [Streptomyces sp. NPDC058430]|uniref:hypothetical protein n=1 Tax=Streptomyces sp. NPDC058430 TaxID=3346495 RepID=UPI00364EAAE1